MFYKISTWALLLAAVSKITASPLSSNNYKRSAQADLCPYQCPPGLFCIEVMCGEGYCPLPGCADCPACQGETSKRTSDPALADRQFECPPGVECGPGPVCTAATCDLAGCADAEVCQGQDRKRSLVERQFGCPPGLPCGHGPECTLATCDLPGCADADVCQDGLDQKRNAETEAIHPVCDICHENDDGVVECGCPTANGGPERREADRICPLYCITTRDGETLCGCAAQDYERSLQGN